MNTETYSRRVKLGTRLKHDVMIVLDCVQRFGDAHEELATDVGDLRYMAKQLTFVLERVQIMLDRLRDYSAEFPAELEERDC